MTRTELIYAALYMAFSLYMRYVVGFGFFKSVFNAAVLLVIAFLGIWYLNNSIMFYKARKKLAALFYFVGVVIFSALLVGALVYSKRLI